MKETLKRIPAVVHLYRMLFIVLADPLNNGHRSAFLLNYLKWYLYQKPLGHHTTITLENGLRSWVYADSDSGVRNLFTRNVNYYELEFIRAHLQPGDFVVDAGCNVGNRTLALADIIRGGLLIDASQKAIERVRENFTLNQIDMSQYHLICKAVGAECGQVLFSNQESADTQNRIVEPDLAAEAADVVEMTTLDHELSLIGNPPCAFIKLDLEGYDLEALRGATETLSRGQTRLLVFERWPTVGLDQFETFFEEIGWRIFAVDRSGPVSDRESLAEARNLLAMPQETAPISNMDTTL